MGLKKKLLSAALCAAMVGTMVAPVTTVQAADDTIVYWSMCCLLYTSPSPRD